MKCLTCQTILIKHQKKFCSSSCSAKFNNVGVRRHSNPQSKWSTVKPCQTCGKESIRIFCSDKCNPNYLTPAEKIIKSKALHNEAWHRYQAKKRNQTPADVDIKALQKIYLDCPDGHEVDHIIPVSKGGLHCPENLQYLTIRENRKKSNKVFGDQ